MQGVSLMRLAFCIGASELFLFYRESQFFYQIKKCSTPFVGHIPFRCRRVHNFRFHKMCNESTKKVAARRLQLVK